MIISVIGTIGSGKDTVAKFFMKHYKFKKITMSDFLRQIEKHRKLKPTRANLRKLQYEIRQRYGEDILMDMLLSEIVERNLKNVVVAGLRTPQQIDFAKKKLNSKIMFVDAKPETRFVRLKKRARQGDPLDYEKFLHEDSVENAMFNLNIGKKKADFFLDNSKDQKFLEKQLKKIAKKLRFKSSSL